jgi:hypothetical protein
VAKTINDNENNALFRNDLAPGNHWLEVNCTGVASNRSAIGARVRVYARMGGRPVRQLRVVEGQSGYCGQNLRLHFGLLDAAVVDSVRVDWPSGATDLLTSVAPNRLLSVREGEGTSGAAIPTRLRLGTPVTAVPNPFTASTRIRYSLTADGEARLGIFAADGRLVRRLVPGWQRAGARSIPWGGTDDSGRPLPAGVYICRVEGGGGMATGRVQKVK